MRLEKQGKRLTWKAKERVLMGILSFSLPFLVHRLFFSLVPSFFFVSFSLGDNGLLTKGMELVGEFIKVINAFTIVQNWCSWGERVAWELLSPINHLHVCLRLSKVNISSQQFS